jgi:hypothetical protein
MMMETKQVERETKMDNIKKYDNTNSGVLYTIPKDPNNEPEWKLIQQGKLNIDGNDMRIVGIKRLNKDGQEMVGLYREIGTIKENAKKFSDNDPDAKGVVNNIVDNGGFTISAWKEISERKNAYVSLKVRAFQEDGSRKVEDKQDDNNQNNDIKIDDDIPF